MSKDSTRRATARKGLAWPGERWRPFSVFAINSRPSRRAHRARTALRLLQDAVLSRLRWGAELGSGR
jgi:hypothetical protein